MTYKDAFVVEVKCRGKFLRVQNDTVRLPFGSEYSLYLKNINSKRASVKISIDGEDVLDNHSLVLEGNSSIELEGFLRGTTAKNRFKFINKTKEIQDYRGDKVDDGMIRIEFAYEKSKPEIINKTIVHHEYRYSTNPFHWNYNDWFIGDSSYIYGTLRGMCDTPSSKSDNTNQNNNNEKVQSYCSNVTMDSLEIGSLGAPLKDEGITVKGSECCQSFNYTTLGELEPSQVIVINLKGIVGETEVTKPITVDTKLTCKTCGKISKSSSKFCCQCGTFLE